MVNRFFASGDSIFFWKEQIGVLTWLPQVFRSDQGFGLSYLKSVWFDYPFGVLIKFFNTVGLSWWMTEKILWLSVFVLGIYASYKLARYALSGSKWSLLAPLIYMTNTYFLLLFGGGQMGVALSYAFSPWVVLKFIQLIDYQFVHSAKIKDQRSKIKNSILNGLWLALLVCFDLRLAYLVLGAIVLYLVVRMIHEYGQKTINNKQNMLSAFCFLLSALCIAGIVHLFWILPLMMVRGGFALGEELTNVGMLKFLSVADFSHALSLLAPNWPENLFGKVYFLQPEFVALPILAFGALLLTGQKTENNKQDDEFGQKTENNKPNVLSAYCLLSIRYFAILALLGAFMAKGANPPFGGIYIWLFEHVPGFVMFRDPTKFYLFTALGYSVLIPYTLLQLAHVISIKYYVLSTKYKNGIHYTLYFILYTLFVIFWLFTIRAVFTGQATGNFRPLELTHEYVELKDLLANDKEPYRTLWIPSADKFVYSSDIHPLLTSDSLWKNASVGALLTAIDSPEFFKTVHDAGVRYVIVPQDLEKRIFLSDYTYDQTQRDSLVEAVTRTGLRRLSEFQELVVFENPTYKFSVVIPEYVKRQEYWSRIGLGLSVMSLILLLGVASLGGKKISTQ